VLGYALVAWSNSKIDASIVSLANCIQPMFATLFASIFLHEQLTWIYAYGSHAPSQLLDPIADSFSVVAVLYLLLSVLDFQV
jgi:drug/metabolite transporter (DMT)-like permease